MATRSRRYLVALLAALALVLIAREAGMLDLYFYTERTTNQYTTTVQALDSVAHKDLALEIREGDDVYHHTFLRGGGATVDLRAVIKTEVSGWTWTPLWKSGHAEFAVTVTSSSPDVHGEISGSLDSSVTGLISARSFKAKLRDSVVEIVTGALAK